MDTFSPTAVLVLSAVPISRYCSESKAQRNRQGEPEPTAMAFSREYSDTAPESSESQRAHLRIEVSDEHVAACEELQIGRQRHAHLHRIPCHVGYHAM